jgi:hypothetical protein
MQTPFRFMTTRVSRTVAIAAMACSLFTASTVAHAASGRDHTQAARRLPAITLQGAVLNVIGRQLQVQPVYTWPVNVLLDPDATVTLGGVPGLILGLPDVVAGMPASARDIQDGRLVEVIGRYNQAQHTFAASHVNVIVPAIIGRVTAVTGATFTTGWQCGTSRPMRCAPMIAMSASFAVAGVDNLTHQIASTSATKMLRWPMDPLRGGRAPASRASARTAATAPVTMAPGNLVIVQAFPPDASSSVSIALRMWVRHAHVTGRRVAPAHNG